MWGLLLLRRGAAAAALALAAAGLASAAAGAAPAATAGARSAEAHTGGGEESHRYGLMIDCGSEGSRLYIFKWATGRGESIVIPEGVGSKAITPGVASFNDHPQDAGISLAPLLDFARSSLAHRKDTWDQTPIFVRATAGMRLLGAGDREDILGSIRTYLKSCPFLFRDNHAIVITGAEEGIFGWLTVNFQMGSLQGHRDLSSENTYGSLDLGGASTQIAFLPEKSVMAELFPLRVGHNALRLYSYSYLHFGQREVAHRAANIIISDGLQKVQSVTRFVHPCFAKDYHYNPSFSYSLNHTFPLNVTMEGTSNHEKCLGILKRLIDKAVPCLVPTCSFYGVYQPRVRGNKFVAFAHFAEAIAYLALPERPQLKQLRDATEYVCSLSVHQLNVLFKHIPSDYERLHLCFHATYIYALLTYGYGFHETSQHITFRTGMRDGEEINYIVGAMIYEIHQDPSLRLNVTQARSEASDAAAV